MDRLGNTGMPSVLDQKEKEKWEDRSENGQLICVAEKNLGSTVLDLRKYEEEEEEEEDEEEEEEE
jgi:hypothetical protein